MHRAVIRVHSFDKIADHPVQIRHLFFVIGLGFHHFTDTHTVFCDRTCLVNTKHINPRQSLDTLHIMEQYLFDARRIALTASATLARRYNPSGIMPITAQPWR